MKEYFYKFTNNLNLQNYNLSKFKGQNSFNFLTQDSSIMYYKINNIVEFTLKYFSGNPIFNISPHLIYYAEVQGPGTVDPHIDHKATTVANFYFESNDAVTKFYEPKQNSSTIKYQGSVQTSNIYKIHDLDEVASFQAKSGESYLLDTSSIHSVISQVKGCRKFINMQWYNINLQTIKNSIII
jgi:hypothetical protein